MIVHQAYFGEVNKSHSCIQSSITDNDLKSFLIMSLHFSHKNLKYSHSILYNKTRGVISCEKMTLGNVGFWIIWRIFLM